MNARLPSLRPCAPFALLAPLALLALLVLLPTCAAPENGGGGGDVLRTGGEIASILTGDDRFRQLGEASARSLRSADDFLPSEEHFIGRAVAATALSDVHYPLIEDPEVLDYINKVGLAVALSSDSVRQTYKGYRFGVIASPEPNAFAAPGGFVFVTSGMLKQTRSEDEVAAVLAHEIAHVTLKHGLKAIPQSNLVETGSLLTALYADHGIDDKKDRKKFEKQMARLSDLFGQSVDRVAFTLLTGGYGADTEFAADQLGSALLEAAGYDRSALPAFLSRLPADGSAGGWLSTHPDAPSRVSRLAPAAPSNPPEPRQTRHQAFLARLP